MITIGPLQQLGGQTEWICKLYIAKVENLSGAWHPEILFYVQNQQLCGWDFREPGDRQFFNDLGVNTQLSIHQRLMDQQNVKDV